MSKEHTTRGIKMQMTKKGQVGFGNALSGVVSLVLIVLVAAGGVIGLAAFKSGSNNADANTTIGYGITSILNLTSQLGTVGTMLAVGLVMAIIFGTFAVLRGRGSGGL